jgi:hypothetical protein
MSIINDGGGETSINVGGTWNGYPPGKPGNEYNPVGSTDIPIGTPLTIMTAATAPREGIIENAVVASKANSANQTYFVGHAKSNFALAARTVPGGQRVPIQVRGPMTLPADVWSSIIDIGGALQQGVPYYVSATTAGKITKTAPGSGFAAPVGIAISPTTLHVVASFPVAIT